MQKNQTKKPLAGDKGSKEKRKPVKQVKKVAKKVPLPVKSDRPILSKVLGARVTQETFKSFQTYASEAGTTVSKYVYAVLTAHKPKPVPKLF